jgi:hypothetical protein
MRITVVATWVWLFAAAGSAPAQTERLANPPASTNQQPGTPADIAGAAGAAGAAASAEAAGTTPGATGATGTTGASVTLPEGVSPYEYLDAGGRWHATWEFLYWWNTNGADLPPMAGTGFGGFVGVGEVSLAGGVGAGLDFRGNPGGRLTWGYWCGDGECDTYGWDVIFFTVPETGLTLRTEHAPAAGRNFKDARTGAESSLLIAFPGVATGNLTIDATTHTWGTDLNVLANLINDPVVDGYRLDLHLGLRYLELLETLRLASVTGFFREDLPPEFESFTGDTIQVYDNFLNRNQFFGPQVGVIFTLYGEVGDLELRGKVACGTTHQTNVINGFQIRNDDDGRETISSGGLLALPSNIGKHTKEYFTIVPEMTATLRKRVCDNLYFTVGGTFIFWNRVIRPGDQIDRVVDLNQLPNFGTPGPLLSGVARPGVNFNQSYYTIYGLTIGAQFVW